MGRVKGCINKKCKANKNMVKYKENEETCPECGLELSFICKSKKCHTVLEENDGKYCILCKAIKADNKDKLKQSAGKLVKMAPMIVSGVLAGKGIVSKLPGKK